LVFTGISTFSNDFQTVLTRAVSIASLPLKQLQNSDSDVLQQKQLLGSLGDGVGALGTSIAALGKIAQNKALVAGSSDSATVSVQATGATDAATYTIGNITSVASAASETSKTGYADSTATQISSTGTVRLVIGSNHYDIGLTPATNNLVGLRDAINKLGVGVTASVLTTGTGLNPNYLSISANSSGATTLQILDDPTGANTNLITSTNQGSNAVFTLNGVPVTKSDNVINNVIAGVTFTIEKRTTLTAPTVTLSLTTDATQLQSAIQDFVTKYNSLVDQVGAQVGPSAGLLSGDFIVREVQSDLRKVTSYQGTGSIQSFSDLGIQAGSDGKLTFDTNVFSALSNSQITSAFDFLGSPTTGFGALADKFSQITDPTSGLIKLEQDGFEAADKRIQSSIGDLNDRISQLQTSMTTRLQAADALQAQLASQQQQLSAILQSLNFTSFGAPGASANGSTGVG